MERSGKQSGRRGAIHHRGATDQLLQSVNVIEAVAEAEGIDASEVQPPLATVINPEALDTLVHQSATSLEVTFRYAGWDVHVDSDDVVTLTEPGDDE